MVDLLNQKFNICAIVPVSTPIKIFISPANEFSPFFIFTSSLTSVKTINVSSKKYPSKKTRLIVNCVFLYP